MEGTSTHNFKKSYKLFSACMTKDEAGLTRPQLAFVYFSNGFAWASDTHILVRVPLKQCTTFEEETLQLLEGRKIHASLLRMLYQFSDVNIVEEYEDVVDEETAQVVSVQHVKLVALQGESIVTFTLPLAGDDKPNFESVIAHDGDRQPIQSLGVRVKYLGALADAIGSPTLKLRFTHANGKVYCEDLDDEESSALGIIMPVHIDEQLPGFED